MAAFQAPIRREATIRTVAERAGVSAATVSRVFSGTNERIRISERTTRVVRDAAREVGYFPNAAARALRRRRSRNIGLLLSTEAVNDLPIDPVAVMSVAAHLEAACARRRYSLTLLRHAGDGDELLMERVVSRSVDGLILTGWCDPAVVGAARQRGIPCVDVWGTLGAQDVCAVEADLVGARVNAIRYAAALGHRRMTIACQVERRQTQLNEQVARRVEADASLAACEINFVELPHFATVNKTGAWLVDHWLPSRGEPTTKRASVVMAHERTCVGFVGALAAHGLACPRDVSVISLADAALGELVAPALTSIEVSFTAACETAAALLIDSIESDRLPSAPDSPPLLECRIIERQSVAPYSSV